MPESAPDQTLGFRQFRQGGCLSYLLYDARSLEAAVIDPRVDQMDQYREFIARNGLKILFAIDTHLHPDHFSGTHLFHQEHGATIVMSDRTQSQRPGLRLSQDSVIRMGEIEMKALLTPGFSTDGLCLFVQAQPLMIFTGNTLLAGATGRTDLLGADSEALWNSLAQMLQKTPDETLVFPGHEYGELLFSTMAAERKRNSQLRLTSFADFQKRKKEEDLPSVGVAEIQPFLEYNRNLSPILEAHGGPGEVRCGVGIQDQPPIGKMNVEKYRNKLKAAVERRDLGKSEDYLFLDVREREEFLVGHIPGTANLPISGLALHWKAISQARRIYLSCQTGRRSAQVALTLSYLGFQDVVHLSGGYQAWTQAGFEVKK